MDGKDFVVERRRVKNARIIVNRQLQVRLIVPRQFTNRQVHDLIHEKSAWIEKQLRHFDRIQTSRVRLQRGEILYMGDVFRFHRLEEMRGRVTIDPASLTITSGINLLSEPVLEAWYRAEARRLIEHKVRTWSRRFGYDYKGLAIRSQKTRWGSCSSKGNLSFNWKLVKAPEAIMDYIILHELTHTQILNHSPAYWEKLASVYPQYRAARTWLRSNSWLLD